ncbi:MAG: ComEC/Rec2 family competence protein [Pirellulaceae bacterium]
MSQPLRHVDSASAAGGAYHPLLLLAAALAAGIGVDRCWPLTAEVWWLGSLLGIFAWLMLWHMGRVSVASTVLLWAVASLGAAWHHDRWNYYAADEIGLMVHERLRPIAVEGVALHSPRWVPAPSLSPLRAIPKGDESELVLHVSAVRDGTDWRPASGWATLDVDGHLLGVRAGDRLRVMALASRPMQPLNPGEFNFAAYERSRRTWCRLRGLFPESVTTQGRGSRWRPQRALSEIRLRGNNVLRRSIQPSRATLAAALLLGAREQLDPDRNEGYLVTGTIHVLSISGLHVGILAWGFWIVLRTGLIPRRPALIGAMLLTVAYAWLTDFQPPVVRATVLVVLVCLARLLGRQALGFNALAFAALIVLAYHPASLFLAGPRLSFLAVAVMILFSPLLLRQPIVDPLDRLIAGTRRWPIRAGRWIGGYVWRLWLTGTLIWAVSLPIVWQQYNLVSPVALVVNLLIWLPIAMALYAGFGALVLGWLAPPLGQACGSLCDGCLWLMEVAIAAARDWPGSYVWHSAPPSWWVAAFYVVLGVLAVFPRLRPARLWLAALATLWLAVAIGLAGPAAKSWNAAEGVAYRTNATQGVPYKGDRPLACTFIAVGHGVACLLELPDGRNLLYDAGKLGAPLGAVRPVSSVLWSRGISHLDAIVISHADSDHFNAVPELLDRFSVGAVYVSPVMFERPQPAALALQRAIERAGVPLRVIYGGDRLAVDGPARLEVLHPPRKGVIGSDNANSILLLVEYAGRRLLLTGDLEPPGLEDVLAEEPLDCDAILAPHHGSLRSDPTGFALWSTPDVAVISGSRNVEDIPNIELVKDAYRARGSQVLHTAEAGSVRIELRASGMSVSTFRPQGGNRE